MIQKNPSAAGTAYTACPLDCPDTCGVVVEHDGAGQLQRVRGNKDHKWSRGSLCGKTAVYHELVNAPNRLRVPMIRRASGFEEATWDQALSHIVKRMDGIDGADVLSLSYAGNMGLVQRKFPVRLMHAIGAGFHDNGVCDAPAEVGFATVIGRSVGPDLDAEAVAGRCDLFVLWGADAKRTAPHLMQRLKRLCSADVPVIVIDIYRSETIIKVEEWGGRGLIVNPGSDAALALGLAARAFDGREADLAYLKEHCVGAAEFRAEVTGAWPLHRIAEITGLSEDAIKDFGAALYGAQMPLIRTGVGFTRRRNGGDSMRAVASLAVTLGHADRLFFQTGGHFDLDDSILTRADIRTAPLPPPVSQVGLGRVLEGGAFHAAFVWGHNPAATLPDSVRVRRGLARDDLFLVVHELFMTETAQLADVVLPATAVTEHSDVFKSYGHRTLQVGWRSTAAPHDQKSNVHCFSALGRAMGFVGDDGFPDERQGPAFEVNEDVLVGDFLALNRKRFTGGEYHAALKGEPMQLAPKVFEDRGTPTGKIELVSEAAEARGGHRVATYVPDDGAGMTGTYQLISAPSTATHNSTFMQVARHRERLGVPTAYLHPVDAESAGVQDGGGIRLSSEHGAITVIAAFDETLPRKTVRIDGFLNEALVPEGVGVNGLTSPETSDLGGGNVLYSARVEIECVPRPDTSAEVSL